MERKEKNMRTGGDTERNEEVGNGTRKRSRKENNRQVREEGNMLRDASSNTSSVKTS